jgi:integrase
MDTKQRQARARKASAAWQDSGKAPATKGRTLERDVLTPDEVARMMDACGSSTTGIRNRAMLAVLYGAAIRIAEACALRPADVVLGSPASIHVNRGKGGKERTVGLDRENAAHVMAWVERRASLGLTGRQPFFCAITQGSLGRPTSTSYWRHRIPALAERVGLDKRVHPHGLRRSAATNMLHQGMPVDVIQTQLGHASIATTQAYLGARSTPEHLSLIHEWRDGDEARKGTPTLGLGGDALDRLLAVEREYGAGTVSAVRAALDTR